MRALASLLYVGFLRPAPGTWGSLVAIPLAWALHLLGGFWLLALATLGAFALGLAATRAVTAGGESDPSWVVIDELVGMWIALFPVSYGAQMMGVDVLRLWPGWVAGFVLFRLFDIWKPWLVGRADRMGTALGVMLDDVVAGVFAALGAIALAGLFHLVLL
ncbi:phosphatidylglycerophosphatase A family protein [Pseudoponticoccus marisrubri]|uniref:Phosphatidylglycerophosphatase A n=1 Tax=Pseudoponticoccus marisrubri TaxID=1685382 RepID=A0A0W7WP42_9RHOB|nr:phosphatidylglycerophosphatase A [Pseudoponticoccus marisrubri]KUF12351.1 phosphatidylglycerophosphatase [Pseudoponticoccus marisrubri]